MHRLCVPGINWSSALLDNKVPSHVAPATRGTPLGKRFLNPSQMPHPSTLWKAPERSFLFQGEVSFGEAQRKPSFHIFFIAGHPRLPGTVRPSGPELVQEEISLVDLDT